MTGHGDERDTLVLHTIGLLGAMTRAEIKEALGPRVPELAQLAVMLRRLVESGSLEVGERLGEARGPGPVRQVVYRTAGKTED